MALKAKCLGVVYEDCYESPTTGEIFFGGNTHRYTPVDASKRHLPPHYPKHLIATDVMNKHGEYSTVLKPSKAKVELIREG